MTRSLRTSASSAALLLLACLPVSAGQPSLPFMVPTHHHPQPAHHREHGSEGALGEHR
ncbi:MAG: hypothetical protein WCK77_04350 [Verrucomicrobiota bacterium]